MLYLHLDYVFLMSHQTGLYIYFFFLHVKKSLSQHYKSQALYKEYTPEMDGGRMVSTFAL